ncbi:hypothetical protein HLB44_10120 [Aquincola sp. S2]|uniref:Uncharacterized protein n=1 Tax=Pseudaquabacterium terrae TaxID=2732868 RepID=A0ABX2EFE8_9BURK|nr:hypothetical protein [Aquabacterium terrae]NRF67339.1 hypothetical protein [Aquabacterium terrae]
MNPTPLHLLADPRWFVPLFIALWIGGAVIMARIAGWPSLAKLYPASKMPAGSSFGFCTGSLGSANFPIRYRRCLRIVLNEQGLYASLMFPFKIGSPAIFIPWEQVSLCQEKQLMRTRTVTLQFRDHWSSLTLIGPIGQVVRAEYEARAQ